MKNIPHQFNDIEKFNKALIAYSHLVDTGDDGFDDGVYGRALVEQGVHIFRGTTSAAISKRIKEEEKKPKGNQGHRTCARDTRRFFIMTGLIDANTTELSQLGKELLASIEKGKQIEMQSIWRSALLSMECSSSEGSAVSHPYSILIRLLSVYPQIERKKLALALDAEDDTEKEFQRILQIADDEKNWEKWKIQYSEYQISNAVKILPSLASQLGDYPSTTVSYDYGIVDFSDVSTQGLDKKKRRRILSKKVTADKIAMIPVAMDDEYSHAKEYLYNPQLLATRTARHQQLVKQIAQRLEALGYELSENPIDCLAAKNGAPTLLLEMKTINENKSDEARQVRLAVGQLFYYEYFDSSCSNQTVKRIAAFDRKISDEHITFLHNFGCEVLYLSKGEIVGFDKVLDIDKDSSCH